MMMSATQYSKWLAERRAAREEAPEPPPPMTFSQWITRQVGREDPVGVLARDLVSECRRVGREPAALRYRIDLLLYCAHAPRALNLSREVGKAAWKEWIQETGG